MISTLPLDTFTLVLSKLPCKVVSPEPETVSSFFAITLSPSIEPLETFVFSSSQVRFTKFTLPLEI